MANQNNILNMMMMICLIYPMVYDMTQLSKQSFRVYISDKWNIVDQCHIWVGFINCIVQMSTYRTEVMIVHKLKGLGLIL